MQIIEALAEVGFELDLRRAAGLGDLAGLRSFDEDLQLVEGALHFADRELPDSLATTQYALNIALNYAANWNQIEAMQLLLDRGAQINAQPPGYYRPEDPGASALHRAANSGRLEAVRWLLDHGADPTLRELRGVPE